MGLPIWTPNIILLKLAAQETLSGEIKRLATQFFLKHIAYGAHSPLYRNDAEALALCQALDELPNGEDNLLLLTDNLSVLQALTNLSINSHKVILRLAAKIAIREKFLQNIVLLWTPGHAGIKWNEKADTLAIRVSESDLNIQWVTAVHSRNQTDATYRGSKYYATLGDIPSIQTIAPWLKNRREDIIIACIISRMIITPALLHRFGLNDNPLCSMCKCDNSIEHILLYCRKYPLIRQSLCRHLNINLAVLSTFKSFISITCSSQRAIRAIFSLLQIRIRGFVPIPERKWNYRR
ncbi:hypothetical protein AVEN_137061-1 [Araneus ventricosus]|uniref:RNase H type-1 domain-containing protein n=1 Tax=Araneus ventricosus TaxID=182803 RepID=A0A4Y2KZ69_ARAVE|nr:hypothetical protein AVEN_137061-1 [Araneus ventricosus]